MPAVANKKLFVYGSLMSPEVVRILLGRLPSKIQNPASVTGFSRHPVKGFAFPGLVRSEQSSCRVEGILFEGLSEKEMEILDWFEDEEYQKIVVDVSYNKGLCSAQALVYLWSHPLEELDLDSSWCFKTFQEEKLASYIENTVKPCRAELDGLHGRTS